jgi:hypothetical protein
MTNQSAITCYCIADDGKRSKIESFRINFEGEEGLKGSKVFPPTPENIMDMCDNWKSPSQSPLSHHIFIWASQAKLCVDKKPCHITVEGAGVYSLRVRPGWESIGLIELRQEWRDSRKEEHMQFFVSTGGFYDGEKPKSELMLRVILIQPLAAEGSAKPTVYKRIQVSQVPINALDWKASDPQSELIALV